MKRNTLLEEIENVKFPGKTRQPQSKRAHMEEKSNARSKTRNFMELYGNKAISNLGKFLNK